VRDRVFEHNFKAVSHHPERGPDLRLLGRVPVRMNRNPELGGDHVLAAVVRGERGEATLVGGCVPISIISK
jgi:hypothetical protein